MYHREVVRQDSLPILYGYRSSLFSSGFFLVFILLSDFGLPISCFPVAILYGSFGGNVKYWTIFVCFLVFILFVIE